MGVVKIPQFYVCTRFVILDNITVSGPSLPVPVEFVSGDVFTDAPERQDPGVLNRSGEAG